MVLTVEELEQINVALAELHRALLAVDRSTMTDREVLKLALSVSATVSAKDKIRRHVDAIAGRP